MDASEHWEIHIFQTLEAGHHEITVPQKIYITGLIGNLKSLQSILEDVKAAFD